MIVSFLFERQQRVVLNEQESECRAIKTGMPQGSILGPLLFQCILMIYQISINGLSFNPDPSKQAKKLFFPVS